MKQLYKLLSLCVVITLVACGGSGGSSGTSSSLFTIGGTLAGLAEGKQVTLQTNGQTLTLSTNGAFTFDTGVSPDSTYDVSVGTAPLGQTCTVSGATGTVSSNVTTVSVNCSDIPPGTLFTVGGTLAGLATGKQITLQTNGQTLTLSTNGAFSFETGIPVASTYDVTVGTVPVGQTCTVSSATGTIFSNVTNVNVNCTQPTWTYMVYVAGDNNLSDNALLNINQMEQVGSTSDVNIVVQANFSTQFSPSQNHLTKRGRIVKDSDTNTITSLTDLSSHLDMGAPQTLTDFIQWAHTNFPADHYALVLWSHGDGWRSRGPAGHLMRGALADDSSNSYMAFPDIATAISSAALPMDLIDFDACLMGNYEIAYQLKGLTQALVASAELEPGDGNPYHTILGDLVAEPTMSALTLADRTAIRYTEYYSAQNYTDPTTKSSFDLSKVDALASSLETLVQHLDADITHQIDALKSVRAASLLYGEPGYHDLGDAMVRLKALTSTNTTLQADIDTVVAAQAAMTSQRGVYTPTANTSSYQNASTLSIYIPQLSETSTDILNAYTALSVSQLTHPWSRIVDDLVNSDGGAPLATTTGNFAYQLTWDDAKADLDLYVGEPQDNGSASAAFQGLNTANGSFSQDSAKSGAALESWTAKPTVTVGDYEVYVNYAGYDNGNTAPPVINATLSRKAPGESAFSVVQTFSLDATNPAPQPNDFTSFVTDLRNGSGVFSDWHYSAPAKVTRPAP